MTRRRWWVPALICSPLALLVPASPVAADECRVPLIAHRGDATTGHTEQSVASMVLAARRGADYVEMDVQAASDGVLYAMHDATLARTVRGSPPGGIRDYTSTQVNAMRLRDGSRIAHVSTILAAVKPYRGVGAFLELKVPRADTRSRLRRLAIAFGTGRVVVSSFRTADLDAYRSVAPNQALALISSTPEPVPIIAPYRALVLRHTTVSQGYRDRLHSAGIRLYVWSANTHEAWAALPSCLDGVMTDRLDEALTW